MSIDILKDQIKNNSIKSLYLFYGQEEYLKKYYLDSIEKSIIDEGYSSLNKVVLDGKADTKKIVDHCDTLPFFSQRRLVIVKNSGLFKAGKKSSNEEGKNKSGKDEFTDFLSNVPSHTCLVFYETEIDKRIKAVDVIKKNGLLVEFSLQKPAELIKWVQKVFKSLKKDIDSTVASQLVDYSEQGMNEILNEINKVALFTGSRDKVTEADIERVCTRSIKSKIFDLTDAIAEKKRIKALKLLDDMINLKEPLPKILFMVTRQFRHALEMKLLGIEGVSLNEAASIIGVSPYAAGKIQKQSRGFSIDILKRAIEDSLEMDLAIKTGKISDRLAVEMLILKFSQ